LKVVFIQYGNHAEAERRLAAGGKETYYAQRETVQFVAALAKRYDDVTVLTPEGDYPEERTPSGVRFLGIDLYPQGARPRRLQLLRELERLRPDHIVLATPLASVLAWALARGIRVLPLFFDSFRAKGWKAEAEHWMLARLLSIPKIEWVSNHGLAAAMDLVRIGVDPAKVLPFDWPVVTGPAPLPPKEAPPGDAVRVLYVGMLIETKGVGDLLEAIRDLRGRGTARWSLSLVGRENPEMVKRAADLGLTDDVRFHGLIAHDDVVPTMREHDIVVVPSRPEYPEGIPATIYEGLCSRSPLVVSDHPMFKMKIKDGAGAVVFRAGDVKALADSLERLRTDRQLYARLSREAVDAARDFFCPLKYDALIATWLSGPDKARAELASYSIASGKYQAQVTASVV
jgi:glycosyltransferase involved in cell wall biosynthesis